MESIHIFVWKLHNEAAATLTAKCASLVQKSASNLLQKSVPTYRQNVRPELENPLKKRPKRGRARPFPSPALTPPSTGRLAPPPVGSPRKHAYYFVDFQLTLIRRPLCLWRGLSIFATKKRKKHIF